MVTTKLSICWLNQSFGSVSAIPPPPAGPGTPRGSLPYEPLISCFSSSYSLQCFLPCRDQNCFWEGLLQRPQITLRQNKTVHLGSLTQMAKMEGSARKCWTRLTSKCLIPFYLGPCQCIHGKQERKKQWGKDEKIGFQNRQERYPLWMRGTEAGALSGGIWLAALFQLKCIRPL